MPSLDERLSNLRSEHAKGRAARADLQAQRRQIDAQEEALVLTLARIEGAIQVISEMMVKCPLPCGGPATPGNPQDPPTPKDPNGEAPAPVGGPPAPATP
jgi:hypothetical protein